LSSRSALEPGDDALDPGIEVLEGDAVGAAAGGGQRRLVDEVGEVGDVAAMLASADA